MTTTTNNNNYRMAICIGAAFHYLMEGHHINKPIKNGNLNENNTTGGYVWLACMLCNHLQDS
jgi:hypothetical protein